MAKRFTDATKWRNQWFRELNLKARLTWIYLCDECDFAGIWKADYGLATFQLNFPVTAQLLKSWFGDKIYFFGSDSALIVQFFEFQYGDSKDSWTAKIKAKQRLESLGFSFLKNKILIPQSPHSAPTVEDSPPSVLIVGVSVGEGEVVGVRGESEGKSEAQKIYDLYPRKLGKEAGIKKLTALFKKNPEAAPRAHKALANFLKHHESNGTEAQFIPYFSTWVNQWPDWEDSTTGTSTLKTEKRDMFSMIDFGDEAS